jgi:hypothetical protein
MIEVVGNLWTYPADVRVITTNGFVKTNGECVMGRGCALEAKNQWPDIAKKLGDEIKESGNHVALLRSNDPVLFSFPVKHKWFEKADIELIRQSAIDLRKLTKCMGTVVLPRPGCGNGQLRWEDVKPVLEPILDDRFHVITFNKE